jgi:2-hydroxy-6-oxonona-2,4-dienedioate hydrolase
MTTIWADFAGHGVKETYIDAGGLWTRMLEAGSGRAPVLLHGTGGHAEVHCAISPPCRSTFT